MTKKVQISKTQPQAGINPTYIIIGVAALGLIAIGAYFLLKGKTQNASTGSTAWQPETKKPKVDPNVLIDAGTAGIGLADTIIKAKRENDAKKAAEKAAAGK